MEVAHSRNSEVFNSFTLETKMKKQGGPRLVWHGIDLHSKHNWGMGAPKQRPAPKRKSLQKRGTTRKEHDRKRRELMWNAVSSPLFLSQAIIHPHKNPIFDTRERKQLIVLNQKLPKDSSHYCPPFKKNSGSPSVVTLHYAVSSEKALCATCTLQSRLDAHQSKTFICEGLGKAYWSHIKGNRSTCGHTIRKYNWPNVNLWLLFFARLCGRNFTQIQCNETSIRKWRNGSKCCVGTKCY